MILIKKEIDYIIRFYKMFQRPSSSSPYFWYDFMKRWKKYYHILQIRSVIHIEINWLGKSHRPGWGDWKRAGYLGSLPRLLSTSSWGSACGSHPILPFLYKKYVLVLISHLRETCQVAQGMGLIGQANELSIREDTGDKSDICLFYLGIYWTVLCSASLAWHWELRTGQADTIPQLNELRSLWEEYEITVTSVTI